MPYLFVEAGMQGVGHSAQSFGARRGTAHHAENVVGLKSTSLSTSGAQVQGANPGQCSRGTAMRWRQEAPCEAVYSVMSPTADLRQISYYDIPMNDEKWLSMTQPSDVCEDDMLSSFVSSTQELVTVEITETGDIQSLKFGEARRSAPAKENTDSDHSTGLKSDHPDSECGSEDGGVDVGFVSNSSVDETSLTFDCDYTVLPSTWIREKGLRLDDDCTPTEEQYAQLSAALECAMQLLRRAKCHGKFVLVTSAERSWIDLSCQKFMPTFCPSLENVKIPSMHSIYEHQGVAPAFEWKFLVFVSEISAAFAMFTDHQRRSVIPFGDSAHEREELIHGTHHTPNCSTNERPRETGLDRDRSERCHVPTFSRFACCGRHRPDTYDPGIERVICCRKLIVQHQVKYEEDDECGGDCWRVGPNMDDLPTFEDPIPYNIMFGPDKCGRTKRTHLSFNHHGKKVVEGKDLSYRQDDDGIAHLYRSTVSPDNRMEVHIDQKESMAVQENWLVLVAKKDAPSHLEQHRTQLEKRREEVTQQLRIALDQARAVLTTEMQVPQRQIVQKLVDVPQFRCADEVVDVPIEKIRSIEVATQSTITSTQRVGTTVTAEISAMCKSISDLQEALKNHDSRMEEVSNVLQQTPGKEDNLTEGIVNLKNEMNTKLDTKVDNVAWYDANNDLGAVYMTMRKRFGDVKASLLQSFQASLQKRIGDMDAVHQETTSSIQQESTQKTLTVKESADELLQGISNNAADSQRMVAEPKGEMSMALMELAQFASARHTQAFKSLTRRMGGGKQLMNTLRLRSRDASQQGISVALRVLQVALWVLWRPDSHNDPCFSGL